MNSKSNAFPQVTTGSETPDLIIEVVESSTDEDLTNAQPEQTESLEGHPSPEMDRLPVPWRHPLRAAGWLIRAVLGIVSLVLILALLAAIPLVNFVVLGYLLEAEGRVCRTGRLRQAFPLLGRAPQIGSIVLGIWIWILPLRFLSDLATDAQLIDPAANATRVLLTVTQVLAIFVAVHLTMALARGGGFWTFFRPIKNARWLMARIREGNYLEQAAAAIRRFFADLRLRHHFSLGFRGFLAAFLWLVIPTALFAAADRTEGGAFLVTIFGALCLMAVFCWIPFLQARLAAENRFRAAFELRTVRHMFGHAPVSWLLAVLAIYVLALPLYLLKVVLVPRDALWFVTLVFLVSIYPARIITGWAYSRAARREEPSWFGWRWLSRTLIVGLVGLYAFLLFFTQFIGDHGKAVLFEHHAFLLPLPVQF